jgi:hypothetical protein
MEGIIDVQDSTNYLLGHYQKISVDTAELQEVLGLTRQQIFNLITFFEKKEIIQRFRSNRTFIEFTNPLITKTLSEKLKLLDNLSPIEEKADLTCRISKRTLDKSKSEEGGIFRLIYEFPSGELKETDNKRLLEEYLSKKKQEGVA